LRAESEAAAFEGRLENARQLRDQAAQLADGRFPAWRAEMDSLAALTRAADGYRPCGSLPEEAVLDNQGERADARASNPLLVALLCDDFKAAARLLDGFRNNAVIRGPARTLIALSAGEHAAVRELLPPVPAELGTAAGFRSIYLRGLAELRAGDGAAAASEFQRIIDHRGVGITSPLYPLAYVQQARAYRLAGDSAGTRQAYETFFKLWARADPDVPILVAARSEYSGLAGAVSK
jgi:hypothetical protein